MTFVPSADWIARPHAPVSGPALVVADTRLDLPHARDEGRWVAERLGAARLERDEATLAAVVARLDGLGLLHFAGHGVLAPEAPWDAHLVLAEGQVLDFGLVLARRPRVGVVVLSGCDTGRPARAPADGVGLPEAFLLAGTRAVLAAAGALDDAAARRFVERFYTHGGAQQPARAYRAAALESEGEGQATWRSFRLYGRP